MQILTGKSIPRRTFLRGMGAAVALPYLDAMVPAFGALGKAVGGAAAATTRRDSSASSRCTARRARNTWGASKNLWAPADVGRDFELNRRRRARRRSSRGAST